MRLYNVAFPTLQMENPYYNVSFVFGKIMRNQYIILILSLSFTCSAGQAAPPLVTNLAPESWVSSLTPYACAAAGCLACVAAYKALQRFRVIPQGFAQEIVARALATLFTSRAAVPGAQELDPFEAGGNPCAVHAETQALQEREAGPLDGVNILVVEDNPFIQMTVGRRLRRLHATTVTIVDNIEDAMNIAAGFDVVLMDNEVFERKGDKEPVDGAGLVAAQHLRELGIIVFMHSSTLIPGEMQIHKSAAKDSDYIQAIRTAIAGRRKKSE
jgi:CheY-like chemotaxis protein